MKKHDNIAVTGVVALLALIGAVKVAQTACALTALALTGHPRGSSRRAYHFPAGAVR